MSSGEEFLGGGRPASVGVVRIGPRDGFVDMRGAFLGRFSQLIGIAKPRIRPTRAISGAKTLLRSTLRLVGGASAVFDRPPLAIGAFAELGLPPGSDFGVVTFCAALCRPPPGVAL